MMKWLKHQRREHRLAFWPSVIVGFLVVVVAIATASAPTEPTAKAEAKPEPTAKADAKPEPTPKADAKPEPRANADAKPEPTAEPKQAPEPVAESKQTPQKRVRDALAAVGGAKTLAIEDPVVKDISFEGRGGHIAFVFAKTPEGGWDGASCEDLDRQSGAIFAEVYDEARWRGRAQVEFEGGLVDTTTGRDLPDAVTGVARMNAGQAKQIDWSDDDALASIDWSYYRASCNPALKQD